MALQYVTTCYTYHKIQKKTNDKYILKVLKLMGFALFFDLACILRLIHSINKLKKAGVYMNITEKIIASHAGRNHVRPDELVTVQVDGILANDVSGPIAIQEFKEMGLKKVFDESKVFLVNDHFAPNCDMNAAKQNKAVRDFARLNQIDNFFDVGCMGIEHGLLPEKGLVLPGHLIIGGDSHTCTYGALGAFSTGMGSTDIGAALGTGQTWLKVPRAIKVEYVGYRNEFIMGKDLVMQLIGEIGVSGALYKTLEFTGSVVAELSMDSRFSMCNMAIEAGAKNGIIAPDETTEKYTAKHNLKDVGYECFYSDSDDDFESIRKMDISGMEPVVACPHLPENVKQVDRVNGIRIDQAVIGSCTNGRIEDLRAAAEIFKRNPAAKHVRTIIIPATQEIYKQAVKEGLVEIFINANAAVSTPTCGPCFGGHMGILAAGERAISTTNRNFIGRMGHKESEVYLSNPYVAAASAVAGEIIHPKEVCNGKGF